MTDPLIIAIANDKGGASKTTIAAALIERFTDAGFNPYSIDSDPNQNLTFWAGRGTNLRPVATAASDAQLVDVLANVPAEHRVIVIDTAGFGSRVAVEAMYRAHLVVIPMQPSPLDQHSMANTITRIGEINAVRAREGTGPINPLIVLSRVKPRAAITAHIRAELAAGELRIANTVIGDRVTHPEAVYYGTSAAEHAPRSAAAREIRALYAEVIALPELAALKVTKKGKASHVRKS